MRYFVMKHSRLYTGGGDRGETSLVGGQRVPKDSLRLDAYGTVDEFSAFLGVILSQPECPENIRSTLLEIQNLLFDIGCILATDPAGPSYMRPIETEDIERIERLIDETDAATPEIKAFVLPGGCPLTAHTHVARTVCRRAERRILALSRVEEVPEEILKWFNRLSDYLFILARHFNHLAGVREITWQPRS